MRTRARLVSPAAMLLVFAAATAAQQPSPEPFATKRAALDVAVDFPNERLAGSMTLELRNWTQAPASRVSLLLNRLMEVSRVSADGAKLPFTQDVVRFSDEPKRQVTQVIVSLPRPVPAGGSTTLRVEYGGNLVGYTEIGWLYVKDRIDTSFTILRADALAFPEVGGTNDAANRRGRRDDFSYDASVRVPAGFVVATGGTESHSRNADGTVTWRYVSQGASPFLNVAIAPFDTLSAEGVRVFYLRADSLGARKVLSNVRAALALLRQWFGPQHGNVALAITEIPNGWGSQANLVGGIIQSAAAFQDSTRANEVYHELTHLWNVRDADAPSPRWNEGLASFLEHLMYERVNGWTGRADFQARYVSWLRDRLARDSTLRTVPFVDYGSRGMTDRSYSVGAVMFATLYELLGEQDFNRVVGGYYQHFTNGATTRDFIAFANRATSRNLTPFFDDWMLTTRWTTLLASATSPRDLANVYRK